MSEKKSWTLATPEELEAAKKPRGQASDLLVARPPDAPELPEPPASGADSSADASETVEPDPADPVDFFPASSTNRRPELPPIPPTPSQGRTAPLPPKQPILMGNPKGARYDATLLAPPTPPDGPPTLPEALEPPPGTFPTGIAEPEYPILMGNPKGSRYHDLHMGGRLTGRPRRRGLWLGLALLLLALAAGLAVFFAR